MTQARPGYAGHPFHKRPQGATVIGDKATCKRGCVRSTSRSKPGAQRGYVRAAVDRGDTSVVLWWRLRRVVSFRGQFNRRIWDNG
jgi:hypothetical protein